jgi:hypothetical protein
VKGSYPTATSPRVVARTIVAALAARRSRTRYAVGSDAKSLIGLSKTLSDRKIDAICAAIFENAAK